MISQEKWFILTPLQNLPKNVEDLGKLIVANGLKKLPSFKKSPNLVTLAQSCYFSNLLMETSQGQKGRFRT